MQEKHTCAEQADIQTFCEELEVQGLQPKFEEWTHAALLVVSHSTSSGQKTSFVQLLECNF